LLIFIPNDIFRPKTSIFTQTDPFICTLDNRTFVTQTIIFLKPVPPSVLVNLIGHMLPDNQIAGECDPHFKGNELYCKFNIC